MNKPLCILQSPLFTKSGYGSLSLDIAKSMVRYNKFDVAIVPTRWGNCPQKRFIEDFESDEEAKQLTTKILTQPVNKQPDLFIQITIPTEFQTPAKFNIGITAGIETTLASTGFMEGLNKMNLNLVTSKFSKEVFENTKYKHNHPDGRVEELKLNKPTEVLNWGTNTSIYKKTDVISQTVQEEMNKIPESFAFLFVGMWTHGGMYNDRKDIGNLVRVFCETFKDKPNPPCLVLKTTGGGYSFNDKNDCLAKIKAIRASITGKLPNVYLLHGELTPEEMNSLYNHPKIKVHVTFTHGEGAGGPILEASLSGKPILAPNWSGHLDYLNPEYSNFFNGEIKPIGAGSVNEWLIKESSWFYVNYVSAEEKLKNIFHNYGGKLLENAEKLRLENMEKFSHAAMDKNFHGVLDKYLPEFQVQRSIVLPKLKKITLPPLSLTKP